MPKPTLKDKLKPLFKLHGTPHQLAVAFAFGVALGIIPGIGALAAAALAAILRLNLPLMVAGSLITNPVTTPFIYAGSYYLGNHLFGDWMPIHKTARVVLSTLAGNVILSLSLALLAYFIVLVAVLIARRKRRSLLV